jgi:hypothetical protein
MLRSVRQPIREEDGRVLSNDSVDQRLIRRVVLVILVRTLLPFDDDDRPKARPLHPRLPFRATESFNAQNQLMMRTRATKQLNDEE